MTEPKLPMNGKDAKIVLFYGGARVPNIDGHVLSWSVKEVAQTFRDAIVGRKRKRTDKKVDGFDADLDVMVPDMALFDYLKAIDDARDANQPLKTLSVGLEFADRTGGMAGVLISNCTAQWEFSNPGQSERLKGKVTLQGEDYSSMAL